MWGGFWKKKKIKQVKKKEMKRKYTSHSNKDDQSGNKKKKKPPLALQQRKDRVISLTDIKGYNLLMDTYIKDGRPEEAIITFDSLLAREHKSSISPDVYTYATVINAHIEMGEFLKGTDRYTEMISRGIIPDVQTITIIMKLYMRLKKPNDAIDCFDFFKEYNLNPNVYSYNTLMDAHIEKADYTEAISVFEVMQDNDVLPDTATITTMMKLYLKVNEPHNAILIHGLFKKYNIPQNEYSFNTLINAYTENGQYDKAFEAFDEMIAKNYIPDVTTINTIMKLHLKLKQPHKAIKAHNHYFKKYGVKENEYSFNILINAFTEKGDYDKAFETFDEMIAKNYIPTAPTISTIMKLHLKLKEPHQAIKAHNYLFKKYGVKENEYSFNTLINAYTENGNYDKAFQTFDEMIAKNCIPNATTIGTIMKLHLKLKQPHQAIKAHTLHKKYGVKENEYSFNILIKAYTEAERYDKAIEVFHQMQNRSDVKMHNVTISSMMHLYNKMNKPDKTIDAFKLYQRYNIEPNIYAYTCLIKAYQMQNNIKAACDTIRMLHSKGIKCDTYTFQPVLRHYQIRGDKRRFYKSWDPMIDKYKVKPDRHLHSIKDKLDQHQGPPLDEIPCRQFQRYGTCSYGRDCKYKH